MGEMMADDAEARRTIHDLNNTLTCILTAAELIASAVPADGQVARDAMDIRDAAVRGRDLVAGLHRLLSEQSR